MNRYSIFILNEGGLITEELVNKISHENLGAYFTAESEIKLSLTYLLKCDFVVTVDDWWNIDSNNKLVQIAQLVDIPVIHITRYKEHVKANYNR